MEDMAAAGDERLLVARAGTDPGAFADLDEVYLDRVYRDVRTYTECDDDAADLTHHVFLRVLEALPRYQDRGAPFASWLFRIARNAAIDTVQQSLRRGRPVGLAPYSLVTDFNAEANLLTAMICHADRLQPKDVCNRPMIRAILKHVR